MKITLYGTKACVKCVVMKRYLDQKRVKYTYKELTEDDEINALAAETKSCEFPQIKCGSTWVFGVDKRTLDKLLIKEK